MATSAIEAKAAKLAALGGVERLAGALTATHDMTAKEAREASGLPPLPPWGRVRPAEKGSGWPAVPPESRAGSAWPAVPWKPSITAAGRRFSRAWILAKSQRRFRNELRKRLITINYWDGRLTDFRGGCRLTVLKVRTDSKRFSPMLILNSIPQTPSGPCRPAMPAAWPFARVNRTGRGLQSIGRFSQCVLSFRR